MSNSEWTLSQKSSPVRNGYHRQPGAAMDAPPDRRSSRRESEPDALTRPARPYNPVPILLYHSIGEHGRTPTDRWQVSAADFAGHMAMVSDSGRTPLSASEYAECLQGQRSLPEKAVVITLDDGYADYVDIALPILERYRLRSTLFITTSWLGRPGMMSAAAVRDLTGGRTEIGAHSATHPHLDTLVRHAVRTEATVARRVLEELAGHPVTAFAYPHGSHRRGTKTAIAESGYRCAFAVKNALSHVDDDPFAIARFTVTARTPPERVHALLAGSGATLARRRQLLRTHTYRAVRYLYGRFGPRTIWRSHP